MVTGKIDVAKPSKSGKTLGVKVNGTWYSTSEWELQNMVGQEITITETKVQDLPGGGSITYLNAYTIGGAAPAHQGTTAPAASPADNALLLQFVGSCMQSFQWTSSSLVAAQTRSKQCYELGQSILNGSIMGNETGPRRAPPTPESEDPAPPAGAPSPDDFDDDIPF